MDSSFVGTRFHRLVVVAYSHYACRTTYWKCLCDCGEETVVAKSNLKTTQSCGCMRKRHGSESQNWRGVGDISASSLSHLKTHAKRRGISVDLSLDFLWELFCAQQGLCALSGIPIHFPTKHRFRIGGSTASIDRIDSALEYTHDNVQWVHKDVNFMKQSLSQERFIELCNHVTERARKT